MTESPWASFLENRFVLCIAVGGASYLLCWNGKISGSEFVTITVATAAAYITGIGYDKKQDAKVQAAVEGGKP